MLGMSAPQAGSVLNPLCTELVLGMAGAATDWGAVASAAAHAACPCLPKAGNSALTSCSPALPGIAYAVEIWITAYVFYANCLLRKEIFWFSCSVWELAGL